MLSVPGSDLLPVHLVQVARVGPTPTARLSSSSRGLPIDSGRTSPVSSVAPHQRGRLLGSGQAFEGHLTMVAEAELTRPDHQLFGQ
jgi:hypothetical protein